MNVELEEKSAHRAAQVLEIEDRVGKGRGDRLRGSRVASRRVAALTPGSSGATGEGVGSAFGDPPLDLPENVRQALTEFVASAERALGAHLEAVVLYGSASEGRLRATSDVNVILVLESFDAVKMHALREPLAAAHAAMALNAMFLRKDEISRAVVAFTEKFADIAKRRRILWGRDPFQNLTIPRDAEIARLRQVLLNKVLRMRAAYVGRGLREEQLTRTVADFTGPIRVDAAELLELEGKSFESPKQALEEVARQLARPDESDWDQVLARLSTAREQVQLEPGLAGPTLLRLLSLAERMMVRLDALGGAGA